MVIFSDMPTVTFAGISDENYGRLSPKVQELVDASIAAGLDPHKPFSITLVEGRAEIASSTAEPGGSVDEINALLDPALPAAYQRDSGSLAQDPLYSAHLDNHWGF